MSLLRWSQTRPGKVNLGLELHQWHRADLFSAESMTIHGWQLNIAGTCSLPRRVTMGNAFLFSLNLMRAPRHHTTLGGLSPRMVAHLPMHIICLFYGYRTSDDQSPQINRLIGRYQLDINGYQAHSHTPNQRCRKQPRIARKLQA